MEKINLEILVALESAERFAPLFAELLAAWVE